MISFDMASENGLIVILILFICVLFWTGFVDGSYFDKPQIVSQYETIIEANDNHSVFCQGNRPLKWSVPEVEEVKKSWTTFTIVSEKPLNTHFQYGLRLYITNMSYPFVGFFNCHYKDMDKEDDDSAKIYLFVNDNSHFSVLDVDYILMDPVTQFEEAVIPCRPTSPDVQVQLQLNSGEMVEDAEYDPKTGFSFFVYDLSQQDVYRCIFLRHSEQSDIYLHLIINPLPVSHLAMPDLREESDGHTEIGDTLILRCAIYSANRVKFNWTTPNGSMDINRMSTNQLKDDNNKVWQDLYVNKTTLKDSGRYSCKVSDYQGHEKDVNLTVKIYDIGENYINISEPNDVYYSLAFAGKDSIQWVVDVRGHPKPIIKWINNKNNTIPDVDGVKYEVSFNNKTNKAMLKIKNIVINDFGNYTLVGNNGKSVQKLNFFLNVTDKPTVHLETKPFHLIGKSGTVRCIAAAYPEPEFRWEYKACQTDECQYVKIIRRNKLNANRNLSQPNSRMSFLHAFEKHVYESL